MADEDTKLEMVIYYIVKNLGTYLTKTKLMKLLFLTDYIAKKSKRLGIGRMITGTKYIYYQYGPFSYDVYSAIDDMEGHEIEEVDLSELSRYSSLFSYKEGKAPRFSIEIDSKEKEIIDFVIDNFGYMSLNDLLTIVYDLDIVKSAKSMDVLLE